MSFERITALGLSILATWLMLAWADPATAGSWQQNRSIGGFNTVHVYRPDSQSPIGNGRALLIVLHGCTQPIGAFLGARLEPAAEAHGMVVAVPDAMHKAGFSCWSYWQGAVGRNNGDYRNLIQLAQALAAEADLGIDPDQIYLAGLSSGATFAMQTACLAPDVFAGVAASAGPSIGTSSSGAIGTCETVSPSLFNTRCRGYAGSSHQSHLDSQVAVIAHGSADSTVNTCYNQQNAQGYAQVYGAAPLPGSQIVQQGTRSAELHEWQDQRVAMLWLHGLGHAWSGGEGASGSFIGAQSINFAGFLGDHFAAANRRVDRNLPPQIDALAVAVEADRLAIEGEASDADGAVDTVQASITRLDAPAGVIQVLQHAVSADGSFALLSMPLADALYEVAIVAIDDQGLSGPSALRTARIGEPPPALPPVLGDGTVQVDGQCATVAGSVHDPNQDSVQVQVSFVHGGEVLATVDAGVEAGIYAASRCALPGGNLIAMVLTTDSTGLSATDSIEFEIDAGQHGNTQFHIDQGHITWGHGYAQCYLAFGAAAFTMRESAASAGQCVWTADHAPACQGPAQACSTAQEPEPPPPGSGTCVQHTAMNYLHRGAGRAYSTGLFWAPDYFAIGSDEAKPGSTYGVTTVSSTDGSHWLVAPCPGTP